MYYKLGRYTLGKDENQKKFEDWCEANGQGTAVAATPEARLADPASFTCEVAVGQETPDTIAEMKTVVVGPGGRLYLTDGHHTLTSFQEVEGPDVRVRLRVLGNLSGLSTADFWAQMQAIRWVWNKDVAGTEVADDALPKGVGLANFANDPYRSLMYFGRDIGYTPGTIPFQEFYWGDWLRDGGAGDLGGWNNNDSASYLAAVDQVTRAQTALPADSVVTADFTASQLGTLGAWTDGKAADKGEFAKLSKPYSALLVALLGHLNPSASLVLLGPASSIGIDVGHHVDLAPAVMGSAGWMHVLNGTFTPRTVHDRVTTFRYENVRPFHPGRLSALFADDTDGGGRIVRSAGFVTISSRPDEVALWDQCGPAMAFSLLDHDHADAEPLGIGQDIAFTGVDLDVPRLVAALDASVLNDDELLAGPHAWSQMADPLPRWDV